MGAPFYIPTRRAQGSRFPTFLATLVISHFYRGHCLNWHEATTVCGFAFP